MELIQHGMDELEDTYLGALKAERVQRGTSSTRPLDAVMADLGLDD
jgi:predicted DNA-binding protein